MNFFENLIFYSFSIFFFYYLLNYAEILDNVRIFAFKYLHPFILGAIQCGFCFSFWTMLFSSLLLGINFYILIVPVIVLYMDFIFKKIK